MTKARNIADIGSNDVLDTDANGVDVTGSITAGVVRLNPSSGDDFLTIQQGGTQAVITADSTAGAGNLVFRTTSAGSDTDTMLLAANGDIAFYDSTGVSQGLFWDANEQRLGLGITTPTAPLDIAITSNQGLLIDSTSGNNAYLTITNNGSNSGAKIGFDNASNAAVIGHHTHGNIIYANSSGNVGINTSVNSLFNAVGGVAKLAVTGNSSSTNILGNTDASIAIINTDQTANNTAGLHFARADTDDTPNYAGASIVAQFPDTQATGQYPRGELAFLTSTSANAAPSEKLRLTSAGSLGIGIVSPEARLDILGNSDSVAALKIGPNANFGHHFYDSATNGDLVIKREASGVQTETMRLTRSGGMMGIGTHLLASDVSLSVSKDIKLVTPTGTKSRLYSKTDGTGTYALGTSGGAAIVMERLSDNSDEIAFETHYAGHSHTEKMRIDKQGRVTTPYQPSFWAYLNANWTSWTPNNQTQVVPFDQAYYNIGNNYNGSTGLYTCPVPGVYVFTCGVYVGVTSVEQIWLVKNGVRQPTIAFPNAGSSGDRAVGTYIVRCAANDTIGLCPYGSPSTTSTVFANFHHSFFMGTLMG